MGCETGTPELGSPQLGLTSADPRLPDVGRAPSRSQALQARMAPGPGLAWHRQLLDWAVQLPHHYLCTGKFEDAHLWACVTFILLDFYLSSPEPWDYIHLPTDPQRMGSKFSLTEHLRDCTVQSHSWARPHHCAAAWGLVKAKHCLFLYCFVSGVFIESRRELSNRLSAYVKEKTQRVV